MTKVYNVEHYAPVHVGDIAYNWDGDKFVVTTVEQVIEFLVAKDHPMNDILSYELEKYALLAFNLETDSWQGWSEVEIHHHAISSIYDGNSTKNVAVTIETAEKYCYTDDGSVSLAGPNGYILVGEGKVRGGVKDLGCDSYPRYTRADMLLLAKANAWEMAGLGKYPGKMAKLTRAIKTVDQSMTRRARKALARKTV